MDAFYGALEPLLREKGFRLRPIWYALLVFAAGALLGYTAARLFVPEKLWLCMLIGLGAAEEIKRSIGCVMQRPDMGVEEVKGRNLSTGLPKTVNLNANELIEAFVDPMNHILEAIHSVLERTPPSLVGDLDTNGIIMSGGGSLIYGMDRLIERSTGIRTSVVDDPVSCAAYGAGKMLKHLEEMPDGMRNFYRMRQLKG